MFVMKAIPMPFLFEDDCWHGELDPDQDLPASQRRPKLDFARRMGNAKSDLNENQTVIILYGKTGHEGKTVFATNISHILVVKLEEVLLVQLGHQLKDLVFFRLVEDHHDSPIMCGSLQTTQYLPS